jgi:hypothetical protein
MKLSNLTKLEARHKVKYDGEDFSKRKITGLEKYANVDDVTLKRADSEITLEGLANKLIADWERLEQERIRSNPPLYSREYVEHCDPYSIMSLYSDYKDLIEEGYKTWGDYRQERRKWRRCKHMFCVHMFPTDRHNFLGKRAKRKDSRYCSDTCRTNHRDAQRRFELTGSYLLEWFYLPYMSESVDDKVRSHEWASRKETIEKRVNGIKRNRKEFPDTRVKKNELKPWDTSQQGEEANVSSSNLPEFLRGSSVVKGGVPIMAGVMGTSSF